MSANLSVTCQTRWMKTKIFITDTLIPALLLLVLVPSMMVSLANYRQTYSHKSVPVPGTVEAVSDETPAVMHASIPSEVAVIKALSTDTANVGDLIEIDASESKAIAYKWVVEGVDAKNYRVYEDSTKFVFAVSKPCKVTVFLAVGIDDTVDAKRFEITVGEPKPQPEAKPAPKPIEPPAPEPKPEPSSLKATLAKHISGDGKAAKAVARAFRKSAEYAADKVITSSEALVTTTQAMVKRIIDLAPDVKQLAKAIEAETEKAADEGKLESLEDHIKFWNTIADAIEQ